MILPISRFRFAGSLNVAGPEWRSTVNGLFMAKSDPTKDPEFQRVLGNLLKAPPKPHADMKVGKAKTKKAKRKKAPPGRG
jgi:hypothetical protein